MRIGPSHAFACITLIATLGATSLPAPASAIAQPAATPLSVCPAGPPTCAYTHIQDAINAAQPGDTINIAAGTYYEHLSIINDATLRGAGPGLTVLDGSYYYPAGSVIAIHSGTVIITGVTVQHGRSRSVNGGAGAGIDNCGALTLLNSAVIDNISDSWGGGIENCNTMTIISSTVTGNLSTSGAGGGISNNSVMTITNSIVSGNRSGGSQPFPGAGSGIVNGVDSAITITQSTISNNDSVPAGEGDGIFSGGSESTVVLVQSTVSGNAGDGIRTYGPLTMTASTVNNNGAGGIVAEFNHPLWIMNSTISDNGSMGIGNNGSVITVTSSTISGNSGTGPSPAPYAGGITNDAGVIQLANTVVAGNTSSVGAPDCYGTLTSLGHNIVGASDGCSGLANGVNGDLVGTASSPLNPRLGPLQNNGGPTATMALLPGSPAIDAVPAGDCTLTSDQRGYSRPDELADNGTCDIGAYEATAPTTVVISPTGAVPFQAIAVTATNFQSGEPVKLFWDGTSAAPLITPTSTVSGSVAATLTVPQAISGTHTLVAVGQESGLSATASIQVKPLLLMPPYTGRAGSTAIGVGFGFGANEPVALYWDKPLTPLGTRTASSLGGFYGATAVTSTVPLSATTGVHYIYAVAPSGRADTIGWFYVHP